MSAVSSSNEKVSNSVRTGSRLTVVTKPDYIVLNILDLVCERHLEKFVNIGYRSVRIL